MTEETKMPESHPAPQREAFEAWISAPPYERGVSRFSENDPSWPGSYAHIDVDLAWQAWKAASAVSETRPSSPTMDNVYLAVRIAAEGSDWKRDSGEKLEEWVQRKLAATPNGTVAVPRTSLEWLCRRAYDYKKRDDTVGEAIAMAERAMPEYVAKLRERERELQR